MEKRISFLHYILNQDRNSIIYKFFNSQMKKRTKRDWVSTVIEDLELMDIQLEMEQIKTMRKSNFMSIIKDKIQMQTFQDMEKIKSSHTKVKEIEHENMKMQKYLQANSCKITKEEAQLIFKLRCRTINVKRNLKGIYDNLNCTACGTEEETQEHVLKCEELNKNKEKNNVEYSKLFNGTVVEQLKIAKTFKENMKK